MTSPQGGVGRVVFLAERGPVAHPVNFRFVDGDIVFRTDRPYRPVGGWACVVSAMRSRGRSRSRTGFETRVTVLGHVQRGGSPTPRDRVLATRYGLKAADLAHEGRYGRMAALRGDEIVDVPLAEATAELKLVPSDWFDVAKTFFG